MENSESKDQNETTQRSGERHRDERMTWHDRLERNLKTNWEIGELFTLSEVYEKFLDELSQAYPANRNLEASTRDVLQQLRDEGMLQFQGDRGDPNSGTYKRTA